MQGSPRVSSGTELGNRLKSLGEGVEDESVCKEARSANAPTQFTCFIDEFNKLAWWCSKPLLDWRKDCSNIHQGPRLSSHSIKHVAVMAEFYVPTNADTISTTRLGNPQFRDWLPSDFGTKKTYWEKKGLTGSKLLIGTYFCTHSGQQKGVLHTMSGTPIDIMSPSFQIIFQNFICYPPALHMETQSKINEIMGDEIEHEVATNFEQDVEKSVCSMQSSLCSIAK